MYKNTDSAALYAMESHRTGNYGSDYPWGDDEYEECPVCGAVDPEQFYLIDNECVGCSRCVKSVDSLREV